LSKLSFGVPEWLRLVPVDFEPGASWSEQLAAAGFDASQPAVVACTGVSMYLTRDAIAVIPNLKRVFNGCRKADASKPDAASSAPALASPAYANLLPRAYDVHPPYL
jgi:O-methyltransferase involved in polyketide biosynthesis